MLSIILFFEAVQKIPSLNNPKGNSIQTPKPVNNQPLTNGLLGQGTISTSNAASNFGNNSRNAGANYSKLTSSYINKPVQTAPKPNINPMVGASRI